MDNVQKVNNYNNIPYFYVNNISLQVTKTFSENGSRMWDVALIKKNTTLDRWKRISKLLCWKSIIYFQLGTAFKSIISLNSDKMKYISKAAFFLYLNLITYTCNKIKIWTPRQWIFNKQNMQY
jgi:hypothetical protein